MAGTKFIDISAIGDKELQRTLNRINEKMQKKLLIPALKKGAEPIRASAKARVPVGTGRLKESLKVRTLKQKRRGVFGAQVETGSRRKLGIDPKAPGYYPMSVEYGFVHARTKQHIAAQPYLRPALDANREKSLRIIATELWAQIRRA